MGEQSLAFFVHDYNQDTFNGSFVFGGGSAPALTVSGAPDGGTTTIDGLEQYRRTLAGIAGGTPTTYQLTSGTPVVPLTQWRVAFYLQDAVKLAPRLTVTGGLRYNFQTTPDSFATFGPRAGIVWAPDKKSNWVIRLHAGLFSVPRIPDLANQVYRLNGARQRQILIYSPDYHHPLTPTADSIQVGTTYSFPHVLSPGPALQAAASLGHDFLHHWHVEGGFRYVDNWGGLRIRNINAPEVGSTTGLPLDPRSSLLAPRPIEPGQNIFQYQSSGHFRGRAFSARLSQQGYKRFGFTAGILHSDFRADVDQEATSPQSSYSERGESARPGGIPVNQVFGSGTLVLPFNLELATEFDASSGDPYNVVTGNDANGDGVFNDRPSSGSVPGPGVYSTRFGPLSTNEINGNIPRNLGTMPGLVHLDLDISRAFHLGTPNPDNERSIAINARTANLLNHTNVNAVGTVVSSPTFSLPLAAETARRLELGIRLSF